MRTHTTLAVTYGQNILKDRSFTSDTSTQIAKALKEYNVSGNYSVKHYKCFIPRMRSLHSKIKKLKLNSVPKMYDKGTFSQKLASYLRARIRLELIRYRKSYRDDEHCCVLNIINCFQRKQTDCRRRSMVCEAHLPSYSTKLLPYGKHVQLSSVDTDRRKSVLIKYVGPDCLQKMARLRSNINQ